MRAKWIICWLFLGLSFVTRASVIVDSIPEEMVYKTIDAIDLALFIYHPEAQEKPGPAIIFFHGGGWNGGSPNQFREHAKYFSSRGLACILAEYRLKEIHGASPFEALKDAKSAIRYLKEHAVELGIDSSKIIASGGSAGGHLAVASSVILTYNEIDDNLAYSSKAAALVLFNPVFDNGPGGYGYDRVGEAYKDFSPLHNLKKGAPPTLLLFGDQDNLVPVETILYYQKVMEKIGSRCDLKLYKGEKHAFFNYDKKSNYIKTVIAMDEFLQSLGYLKGEPTLNHK